MSTQARNREDVVYLRQKEGSFYLSTDKEFSTPLESVTGKLTKAFFKEEEFNGKKIEKLYLGLSSEKLYYVNIGLGSKLFQNVVGFLKNADLSKELTIAAAPEEGKDGKTFTTLFFKQDGATLKSFYNKESGNKLPEWETVKFPSGKEMKDNTAYLNELKRVVNEEISPEPTPQNSVGVPQSDAPDDLPF